MKAIILLASIVLFAGQFVAHAATAADLKLIPRASSNAPVPASTVSIQAYGDHDPSCQVWTDGCRNCDRTETGSSCSNIGIACQPGPIRCTTRK